MSSTLIRRAAASTAAAAVLLGGALAVAPAASASTAAPRVGSSACTNNHENHHTYVTATVKFRTGPGGTAKGQLSDNTDVYSYCSANGAKWEYVKVTQGKWKGHKGWVSGYYVHTEMGW